jgi:hypothetical protein
MTECLPIICSVSMIFLEELINLRTNMKNNNPDCLKEMVHLIENYKKYNSREKKLIRETLRIFLEQNISAQNSNVNLDSQEIKS